MHFVPSPYLFVTREPRTGLATFIRAARWMKWSRRQHFADPARGLLRVAPPRIDDAPHFRDCIYSSHYYLQLKSYTADEYFLSLSFFLPRIEQRARQREFSLNPLRARNNFSPAQHSFRKRPASLNFHTKRRIVRTHRAPLRLSFSFSPPFFDILATLVKKKKKRRLVVLTMIIVISMLRLLGQAFSNLVLAPTLKANISALRCKFLTSKT